MTEHYRHCYVNNITCIYYCWSSCCSDMSNFHRISTCVVLLRVFSNSMATAESQDTFSSKICFKMLIPRARESPLIKMCLFQSYIACLLLGTTGSPSLCRGAEVDPHRRMDAVSNHPSGATDWEQHPTEGQGEGGKGKGTSTAAFRKADTAGTQRAGRPEPTVKAQGEFGTNWLADLAARCDGPFSHQFKGKRETAWENCWQDPLTLATHHLHQEFSRNGPLRKADKHRELQILLPQPLWWKWDLFSQGKEWKLGKGITRLILRE